MLKNKLFFFYLFVFAFYFESFAMLEGSNILTSGLNNSSSDSLNGVSKNLYGNNNRLQISSGNNKQLILDTDAVVGLSNHGGEDFFLVASKQPKKGEFNKLAHIFVYFALSPLLNVNNLDWRHYFFQGQLNRGGVFFYYGLLNFGIGFNRKTFCDTCSCRIVGLNLLQFLGSFVLYFFIDKREKIKTRWNSTKNFLYFLLFNDAYFKEHIENIDSESKVAGAVKLDSFMSFMCYSFSIFPFLSFFTFDFQLFEYLSFSLNIGSFLFLTVAFFVYTFYKHFMKPFGHISKVIDDYNEALKGCEDDTENIL